MVVRILLYMPRADPIANLDGLFRVEFANSDRSLGIDPADAEPESGDERDEQYEADSAAACGCFIQVDLKKMPGLIARASWVGCNNRQTVCAAVTASG